MFYTAPPPKKVFFLTNTHFFWRGGFWGLFSKQEGGTYSFSGHHRVPLKKLWSFPLWGGNSPRIGAEGGVKKRTVGATPFFPFGGGVFSNREDSDCAVVTGRQHDSTQQHACSTRRSQSTYTLSLRERRKDEAAQPRRGNL